MAFLAGSLAASHAQDNLQTIAKLVTTVDASIAIYFSLWAHHCSIY
jgi:hypothetical protein